MGRQNRSGRAAKVVLEGGYPGVELAHGAGALVALRGPALLQLLLASEDAGQLLDARDERPAFLVARQQRVDGRGLLEAALQAVAEFVGILTDASDVKHGRASKQKD